MAFWKNLKKLRTLRKRRANAFWSDRALMRCPFVNLSADYIFFWSFEISEGILTNLQIIIGLDSFSNLRLIYLAPFGFY